MNILVWTCRASIFLSCVLAKTTEPKYDPIFGHRIVNPISKESNKSREQRRFFRKKYLDEVRNYKPELHRFKDALTYSEQISRRPLDPHSCRKAYVQSKNYTRKSIIPEYLICDSQFKIYGEDVEKEALESLERRFAREKKAREEKERLERRNHSRIHFEREEVEGRDHTKIHLLKEAERRNHSRIHLEKEEVERRHRTTVHPMFRTRRTLPTSTTENSREIIPASSRILHELEEEQNKIYTGRSECSC